MDDQDARVSAGPRTWSAVHALIAVGQVHEAIRRAQAGLARDPHDPDAYGVLASALLVIRRYDEALRTTDAGLALAPEHHLLRYLRGVALGQVGRFAEAERQLHDVLAANPDDTAPLGALARLYHRTGHPLQALEVAERALQLTPDAADLHVLRAALMVDVPAKSWRQTEDGARDAVRLDPSDDDAVAVLAAIVHLRGGHDEAEALVRRVLSRNAEHQTALRVLQLVVVARSPWLAPLFAWGAWLVRHTPGQRTAILLALWFLGRAVALGLSGAGMAAAATAFNLLWLVFCVYTWFAWPITRWVLTRYHPWLRG